MKQTIEIEVPDGYKAVYNEDTQKIEFKEKELPKINLKLLPKTWGDFCATYPIKREQEECFIDENSEICIFSRRHRNLKVRKNLLPNVKTARAFLALMQLIQLRDCYRQGWKPDWKDNTIKHCIICLGGVIDKDWNMEHWNIGEQRVLSFQSEEVRDEFFNNFRELIEQAKELI